jgi:hypothetical protein
MMERGNNRTVNGSEEKHANHSELFLAHGKHAIRLGIVLINNKR